MYQSFQQGNSRQYFQLKLDSDEFRMIANEAWEQLFEVRGFTREKRQVEFFLQCLLNFKFP